MIIYDGNRDLAAAPTLHTAALVSAGTITNRTVSGTALREVLTLREHGRADWSLFYCEEGSMDFDGETLHAGELWLYEPDVRQCYFAGNEDTRYHYIHFTGSCLDALVQELGLPLRAPFRPDPPIDPVLFERLEQLYLAGSTGLETEWRLLRLFSAIAPSKNSKKERNLFSALLEEMNQTYYEPFDAARYAAKLDLSVSRFNHLFREQVGESPLRYYIGIRMANAAHLLKYTNYPIGRVASSVGYEDPLYFARVFRKWAGCSPRAYRREQEE
ncbi:MAG: helix-turn-helix transcriptional regulator [Lachnospiraceae bacterium]|nr:helix-turn-helix transcriptional regulator [Lachnospiraceae bacterium]